MNFIFIINDSEHEMNKFFFITCVLFLFTIQFYENKNNTI